MTSLASADAPAAVRLQADLNRMKAKHKNLENQGVKRVFLD